MAFQNTGLLLPNNVYISSFSNSNYFLNDNLDANASGYNAEYGTILNFKFSTLPYDIKILGFKIEIKAKPYGGSFKANTSLAVAISKDFTSSGETIDQRSTEISPKTYLILKNTDMDLYNYTTYEIDVPYGNNYQTTITALNQIVSQIRSGDRFGLNIYGTYISIQSVKFQLYYSTPFVITTACNPIDGGTISVSGTTNYGDTCTLTAIPSSNFSFLQWSNNSKNNPLTLTITKDENLTAYFQSNLQVYCGTKQLKNIYVGTNQIKAIYRGTTKIY